MGNGLEHLAAWRGRDPLTIWEAASLIAGVRPSKPFITEGAPVPMLIVVGQSKPSITEKTPAVERTEVELQVFDWYQRIKLDAASGKLTFAPKLERYYVFRVEKHYVDYLRSKVAVEDLCTWLQSIGHRPAFFFPESTDKGSTEPQPERGHANESDELRWAFLASSKWWKDADRDDKTTHHTNKTVSDWLREKNPNCRIPDDYIDARRYPLLAAREVMRQVVDDLLGRSTFAPGALA